MTTVNMFAGLAQIDIPGHWTDQTTYTYVAPMTSLGGNMPTAKSAQGFHANVVVTQTPTTDVPFNELVEIQLQGARQQLPSFSLAEDNSSDVQGRDSRTVSYTFVAPPQNIQVKVMQCFIQDGAGLLTLTFTTVPSLFDEQKKDFEAILNSIKFDS